MSVQTYLSTDWIEVHNQDKHYLAKVFLTADDECYMLVVQKETKLFKVDSKLLRLGEIGFFEKVMESAKELPLKMAFEVGFITK
jgi:hypothetical protein